MVLLISSVVRFFALRAKKRTTIGDRDADRGLLVRRRHWPIDLQVRVGEAGVAHAVAERKQRLGAHLYVIALPVRAPARRLVVVVDRQLPNCTREADRQFAAGCGATK